MLLVDDPLFDEHRTGAQHPERPERLVAARRAVGRCEEEGIATTRVEPRDATDDELNRAHTERYLAALGRLAGRHAALDADTPVSPGSVPAARRAAGSSIALVEALARGDGPRLGVA